jgi:hypothetical protein
MTQLTQPERVLAWRVFQRKVAKARRRKAESIDLLMHETGVTQPSDGARNEKSGPLIETAEHGP